MWHALTAGPGGRGGLCLSHNVIGDTKNELAKLHRAPGHNGQLTAAVLLLLLQAEGAIPVSLGWHFRANKLSSTISKP